MNDYFATQNSFQNCALFGTAQFSVLERDARLKRFIRVPFALVANLDPIVDILVQYGCRVE